MDFPKPEHLNLDGNLKENWKRFKSHFEIYSTATKTDGEDEKIQVARFLSCAGTEAIELFHTFELSSDEQKKIEKVKAKFEEYCNPRTNVVYERYRFYMRNQKEGEPFDHFLKEISTLVESCSFGDEKKSMLRDRIVIGIADHSIQAQLLKTSELTLEKAVDTCRVAEMTGVQSKIMQGEAVSGRTASAVDAIGKEGGSRNKAEYHPKSSKNSVPSNFRCKENAQQLEKWGEGRGQFSKIKCTFCSYTHLKGKCPAYGKKCAACGKVNHFASMCRKQKLVSDVAVLQEDDDYDSDELFIDAIKSYKSKNTCWTKSLTVENTEVIFKLDTGSQVNILPRKLFDKIRTQNRLKNYAVKLEAYGGFRLEVVGAVECEVKDGNKKYNMQFVVVEKGCQALLGLESCMELGLVARIDSISQSMKEKFIKLNEDIFEGYGFFPDECRLELKKDAQPVNRPPKRIPLSLREKVKETLGKMEKRGVISRVNGPCEWSHQMVVIEKRDGTLRICLDPKELNAAIKDERCMLPTFEDFRNAMRDYQIFTVLDFKEGFWQLKLDEKSKKLTVFSTPYSGCYNFNVLPLGVKVAAEIFQKINNKYFGALPGTFVFVDDLIIGGKNSEEHDENLSRVLQRARELGIKFNKKKVQFRVEKVRYLGHIFSAEGTTPDPVRVEGIKGIENPKNQKDLQKILGTVNYLRPFIPKLADMIAPFRDLLKKNVVFT
ncbi:uncharacterized protein K02A2.6-like [Eupeodes corollae]|uniref:uncharacterized protein K02A2.6-like n=1 Tax=Eupeodes corollae TaxID=290404 RepID=UPI00248FCA9E|nr:uncharacterized protein K02A2.6-like [Eupeodes corollae]